MPAECRARIVDEITQLLAALQSCNGDDSASGAKLRSEIKARLRQTAIPLWAEGIPDE
jgi:hypothetical protein